MFIRIAAVAWLALWLVAAGCSCAETTMSADGGALEDDVGAARDDVGPDATPYGPGTDCDFVRNPRPMAPMPAVIGDDTLTIDLARWSISSDGTHPDETTNGINMAIASAAADGIDEIHLPAGTYAIGTLDRTDYTGGIVLPSSVALVMDEGASLALRPTSAWNYCVIRVAGQHDVRIQGGHIVGDRDAHTFRGGDALDGRILIEEAHGICIEEESERIEILDVHVEDVVSDAIFVVGLPTSGSHCTDVTIRGNDLQRAGRQGITLAGSYRVLIEDNDIHDVHGAQPEFGIDIEAGDGGPTNREILITGNRFIDNQAGDLVNTDGRNVWFEDNDCAQGSPARERQIDGPVIYHLNSENTIVGNRITMTRGTVNGLFGILGYNTTGAHRTNPIGNVIEDNVMTRAGIHMLWNERFIVARNHVTGSGILAQDVACLSLFENVVDNPRPPDAGGPTDGGTSWAHNGATYMLRRAYGTSGDNLANGMATTFELSETTPTSIW